MSQPRMRKRRLGLSPFVIGGAIVLVLVVIVAGAYAHLHTTTSQPSLFGRFPSFADLYGRRPIFTTYRVEMTYPSGSTQHVYRRYRSGELRTVLRISPPTSPLESCLLDVPSGRLLLRRRQDGYTFAGTMRELVLARRPARVHQPLTAAERETLGRLGLEPPLSVADAAHLTVVGEAMIDGHQCWKVVDDRRGMTRWLDGATMLTRQTECAGTVIRYDYGQFDEVSLARFEPDGFGSPSSVPADVALLLRADKDSCR